MTLELRQNQGRLMLKLRVSAGAAKSQIQGIHAGALKLSVTEAPDKGKANRGILKLLAKSLDIPVRNIEISSGHTSQNKVVAITDIDASTLRQKLKV